MTRFVVVGAGVFGLSTAYHLLKDGELDVIVLDKSDVLPAPDGSSTDINRIVRSSYGNPFYSNLTREAISSWNADFPGLYHESGVLVLGNSGYYKAAQVNDVASGAVVAPLTETSEECPVAHLREASGYLNKSGGWADAEGGTRALLTKVQQLGGKVFGGKAVVSPLFSPTTHAVTGVKLQDGEEIPADVVIFATGSWTPSLFSSFFPELSQRLTATGQSVGFVQLSEPEMKRYESVPVVLNFDNGFYVFPPNRDRLLKFAIHHGGYVNLPDGSTSISTPRTASSHGPEGLKIPKVMAEKLRAGLREVYPELAERPFCKTRLCWYADTEDENWIIDEHPKHPNLYIATGDSGHAFKFLPVLGRLVVQRIRSTLNPSIAAMFSLNRSFAPHVDPDRLGRKIEVLREEDLIGPE
ncbi:hypothetical protein FS837_005885 [Tulasnella sp. UAMH 9824]|nr:hypothetical protein FS837_005885 [Tulasnella sp. UAMH 9824]